MGFTLRAALAVLGSDARIVVAELVPAVIAWARGPMADIFGDSLDDPRASIREADVVDVVRSHNSVFDAMGVRPRTVPFTADRVKAAMSRGTA